MTFHPPPTPSAKPRPVWRGIALWCAVLITTVAGLHYGLLWAIDVVKTMNAGADSMIIISVLIISLIVYAVLIATPFMPGIEVGIALLVMQGAAVAPFVYLATITGLMTAYLIGNRIPFAWLTRVFSDLGLRKASAYIHKLENTPAPARLDGLRDVLPVWLAKLSVAYRYASIGFLLNVPGTFAIGGGGGILMAAGLSRLFNGWAVLLTLCIATLPIPLLVWISGVSILGLE